MMLLKYAGNLLENTHVECDFNKAALELYWNCTSAWVFSCKFDAYFQNSFCFSFCLSISISHFHTYKYQQKIFDENLSLHLHAFYWFFYKHSCLQHRTTKEWSFLDTSLSTLHCFYKSNRIKEKILMCYFFIYCLHSFVFLENHYTLFFQLSVSVA